MDKVQVVELNEKTSLIVTDNGSGVISIERSFKGSIKGHVLSKSQDQVGQFIAAQQAGEKFGEIADRMGLAVFMGAA